MTTYRIGTLVSLLHIFKFVIDINILGGIDDVIVPEKLLPYFGLAKNPLRLKANVDFSKYDRLFNIDESLKPVSF